MGTVDESEIFPWNLRVYDAHCHPTDTMSSISAIPHMKTRVLTVMGTRAQDQSLVTKMADKHGIQSADPDKWARDQCIVPCFGWHPWFSHMMHVEDDDEALEKSAKESGPRTLTGEEKIRHYQNILQPSREDPNEEDKRVFLSLPDPMSFSAFLHQTRTNLGKYPLALVGEVGLDRSFRIPEAWVPEFEENRDDQLTPGGREGRRLTPFRCNQKHQKAIFKKQLQLAAEYKRAVSIHGVQAHGLVYETLKELWEGHEKHMLSKRERKKRGTDHSSVEPQLNGTNVNTDESPKPYPPRICLHSYSGSPSNFKQYLNPAIPVEIFASFSTAINLGDAVGGDTPQSFIEMVRTVPDSMVLVESDLHCAGYEMDRRLEDIVRRICTIKSWSLEEGAKRLEKNWRRFAFGVAV